MEDFLHLAVGALADNVAEKVVADDFWRLFFVHFFKELNTRLHVVALVKPTFGICSG